MKAKAIHSMVRVFDETRSVDFYRRASDLRSRTVSRLTASR